MTRAKNPLLAAGMLGGLMTAAPASAVPAGSPGLDAAPATILRVDLRSDRMRQSRMEYYRSQRRGMERRGMERRGMERREMEREEMMRYRM